jgi:cobalamin biosynthesis Mg chelatase CobN
MAVLAADPTLLTTRQILHEIENLKELIFTKLESGHAEHALIQAVVETRLDGMDKATVLLQGMADKLLVTIDTKITALREVHNEKFSSIKNQFTEMDVRTERSSKDNNVAVGAAFSAAKEAVGEQNKSSALAIAKSEAATGKQIEQLQQLIVSGNKALDDKLNDVKERLTRVEGASEGKTVADTSHHTSSSTSISIIFAVIAFASLVVGTIVAIWK